MAAPKTKADKLPRRPSIRPDRQWSEENGGCFVAGVDEAGRGPLAGPVVAAAVIWDFDRPRPNGLQDSKLLDHESRVRLAGRVKRQCLAWGVGVVHAAEIDAINILEASRLAAQYAVEALPLQPGALITDFLVLPGVPLPQLPLVKGDGRSASIAAASILAKTTRDEMMDRYHEEFPAYGWNSNRGYPTPDHYEAIGRYGPTTLHRLTFNGVSFFCEEPLRSPSYHRFSKLCAATPRTPDALVSLVEQIESCRERLPPPDYELLIELIERRKSEG